jgi:hypothetical protein
MKRLIHRFAVGGALVLLALVALPTAVSGQALPTPAAFARYFDLRCFRIPVPQPPLGVTLRLDHLNPYFVEKGLPFEIVDVREPQDLCVPVYKETLQPTPDVLPFLRFADLKCYGITGPSLDLDLHLDQLNPIIANLFGPSVEVVVREPQQLCVPVYKNNAAPPPAVRKLISWLDLKCYRIEAHQAIGGSILLTHLNPLFATLAPEKVDFSEPAPNQLCVPVMKNLQPPPPAVRPIVSYADVLCYDIKGQPLNQQLTLTHLNPVLVGMGLPPENVPVRETHKLCVPVAKNGFFPPG